SSRAWSSRRRWAARRWRQVFLSIDLSFPWANDCATDGGASGRTPNRMRSARTTGRLVVRVSAVRVAREGLVSLEQRALCRALCLEWLALGPQSQYAQARA